MMQSNNALCLHQAEECPHERSSFEPCRFSPDPSSKRINLKLFQTFIVALSAFPFSIISAAETTETAVLTPDVKIAFVESRENSRQAVFERALKAAEEGEDRAKHGHHLTHNHGDMCHMEMVSGGQMLFNPGFGADTYHTHPAGMWMFNYKFMRMNMRGLRDGTRNVGVEDVIPMEGSEYGYMMAPTDMTMDMHMFMVMYGITDRLTLMSMANYLRNEMNMLMNMGMGNGNTPEPPMRNSGLGDTEIRGVYKINRYLDGSLGLSLPTGDIERELETMGRRYRLPYGMQLGSGTYDLMPAITYTDFSGDARWNWGAQAVYTWRPGKNKNDWSFGDRLEATGWLQRAFGPFTSWLRLAYIEEGQIKGRDSEIQKLLDPNPMVGAPSPDADPANYGGRRIGGMLGLSFMYKSYSIGVEGGAPLYQDLNGLQLKTTWFLNVGIQGMF
jgi:hypothetical protein